MCVYMVLIMRWAKFQGSLYLWFYRMKVVLDTGDTQDPIARIVTEKSQGTSELGQQGQQ